MNLVETLGVVIMGAGATLSAVAAWGIVDFPSALSRMHAATKSASLGLGLIVLGAGIAAGSLALFVFGVLVAAFLFMTAPISGHMLGRAAYLAGDTAQLVHDDLRRKPGRVPQANEERHRRFSLGTTSWLVLIWVILWRDPSLGTLLGGIAVAVAVQASLRRTSGQRGFIHLGGLMAMMIRYVRIVVVSNIRVAWEVVTPRNDQIKEAVVAVPLTTRSLAAALLVANAVSYTPGSLTIEMTADPFIIYVHVLHFTTVDDVRAQVASLEAAVMRALPDPSPASRIRR